MEATITTIGLEKNQSIQLAKKLNHLLANYQVFYMNTRGFHWNIKGNNFFELHVKFEELYTDFQLKIDEIAERILTLGFTPVHSFADYLDLAQVPVAKNVTDGRACVAELLNSFQIIIGFQRELLDLAGEANDEGTSALMSDYIREQEKLVWMYSAWMGQ